MPLPFFIVRRLDHYRLSTSIIFMPFPLLQVFAVEGNLLEVVVEVSADCAIGRSWS